MEFLKIPEIIEFTLTFKDLVQSEMVTQEINSIQLQEKKKMESFSHLIFMNY